MVLFFVYIVFYVDPASGLPNTINVCVCVISGLTSLLGHCSMQCVELHELALLFRRKPVCQFSAQRV